MTQQIKDERIDRGRYAFDISYVSEKGARPVNEDALLIGHSEDRILLAAADGLGAHGGGDIAAQTALAAVREEYMKAKSLRAKSIYNIFRLADSAVTEKQTDSVKMKTTLSCVLIRNKRLYAAHIGDTRIYTFKNNRDIYITADHSAAYEEIMQKGGSRDEIRSHPNRHILNAAVGV